MIRRFETDPVDRDEKLGEAIEAYLTLAEASPAPDPEEFAARYPDLSDDLRAALEGLALVRGLVGEPNGLGQRLEAGRRVAGYRIVRELGRGGMGVVYEAVHVDLDRPVALKVLGTHAAPDSTSRRRFLNEARTAAGLHHTHIVPVFDVGQVGGLCYYAMQRIEGCGLDRVIRALRRDRSTAAGTGSVPTAVPTTVPQVPGEETGSWAPASRPADGKSATFVLAGRDDDDAAPNFEPPRGAAYYRWAAEVGRQAAEALAHAHRRGFIHRDVKPSNLLVDGRGMVWVADFGLARRLDDPNLTQSDSRLGTPRYMSPEQAECRPVDGRTDVYSLGATLYELLTLRPPFEGRTAVELTRQIVGREPASPRQADPRIPRDLETIVLKAMAKRPADRYPTSADLAEDLGRYLGHEPVLARRIGPVGRLWRFARRHPSITAVSTAATVTVLAVATVAYVRVVHERDLAIKASREKQAALEKTEAANRETQAANRKTQGAMREQLLSQATLTRKSHLPNRRDHGLKLLQTAAALGPEPALRAELRDEAIELLSLRDVEAREPSFPTGPVQGLVFAPDGARLVTLSDGGANLQVWDVARRQQVLPDSLRAALAGGSPPANGQNEGLSRFTRPVAAGPFVALMSQNGRVVRRIDPSTGESFNMPMPPGHFVFGLLASSDGHRLLTIDSPRPPDSGRQGGPPGPRPELKVNLWDPERLEAPIATLEMEPTPASEGSRRVGLPLAAIAPDGETIATARIRDSIVSLWSKDGQHREDIDTRLNLTALALGPDGLLAAASNGTIQLWSVGANPAASGQPSTTPLSGLSTRQTTVNLLRFSPDGTMLAVAGPAPGIELWNPATGGLVAALPMADMVYDLAFTPDGRMLAAGGQAQTVSTWAVVEPLARVRLREFKDGSATSLAFGPGGLLAMASSWAGELRFWNTGCPPAAIREQEEGRNLALAFDGRQRLLILGPDDLRRLPTSGGSQDHGRGACTTVAERIPLPGHESRGHGSSRKGQGFLGIVYLALAGSADGRVVVLVRNEEFFIDRDGSDGLRRLTLEGMPEARQADFGRAGGYRGRRDLAIAPSGDRMYLTLRGKLFAFTLDGNRARRLEWPIAEKLDDVACLALSPDGRTLALGDKKGGVVLVDTTQRTGPVRLPLPPSQEEEGEVHTLAFAPRGGELAVGTHFGTIQLWKIEGTPEPLVRLSDHRGEVVTLAYDSEGHRLASSSRDKGVVIWDLERIRRELDQLGLGW